MITAATVDQGVLEHSLEATAHNLFQFNPSPEIDSALERVRSLATALPPGIRRGMLISELDRTIASNLREHSHERAINGWADSLVADLRRLERNGGGAVSLALTAKSIARRLRDPLQSLSQPASLDAAELVNAAAVVAEVLAAVPKVQLLSKTVHHELGEAKYSVLVALVESRQTKGAAPLATAGTQARGNAHDER